MSHFDYDPNLHNEPRTASGSGILGWIIALALVVGVLVVLGSFGSGTIEPEQGSGTGTGVEGTGTDMPAAEAPADDAN
ncbi:hypothetical protein [Aquicoccus sp.]|uniref:hypothetical protein n=1 Tax=Aquicoccus sp. TaxID=2055851 RepID=UPI0035666DAB